MNQRIYTATTPEGQRLVKATRKSQAISHVVSCTISAEVSSQDDLVRLLKEELEVEEAKGGE